MTKSQLFGLLNDIKPGFLAGLSQSALHELVNAAEHRKFTAGSVILRQGSTARRAVLIVQGQVRITFTTQSGRSLLFRWYSAGDVLGLATLLPNSRQYFLTTEAAQDTWCLLWERDAIRSLAARHPVVWENAFSILSDYLSGYLLTYITQLRYTAAQRLARVLVDLSNAAGRRTALGIELSVRNDDLANAANITPFTASRLLNKWQRDGVLVKSRGKVILRSLEGLLLREI